MASRQDPTAAGIAYAQYSAAEKTRTVDGCVYHRIICKTPLPAPAGGVELIVPRAMFRGARAGCVEDERAIHGLEGWIACYEKCRLAGTVFAGGVTEPGAVAGHPALETARAMGAAIA